MKSWKKDFKSAFSGFSLSDLTYRSWKSWKGTSFVRKDEQVPEDIKNAYKQTSDLITVMDLPFKVELKLNNDSAINDKSRVIKLPTKIFDDDRLTEEEKVLISTGQAIHEAEHLKETELYDLKSETDPFRRLMSFLIEDERIEDKLLSERPGFSNHIQEVRKYDTKKVGESKEWKALGGTKNGDFFKNLFALTRYPGLMDEDVYNAHKDVYDEVKDILSKPLSKTSDSVLSAGKIHKKIKKYLEDTMTPEEERSLMKIVAKMAAGMSEDTQGGLDMRNSEFSPNKATSCDISDNNYYDCKTVQGDSEYGTKSSVMFTKEPGNRSTYNHYKNKISPYISAIKKLLMNVDKNYEFAVRGMRSGILDVNKIAEAYQGIPQVYVRKGTVTTNKTRICILVDESGSMGGEFASIATQAAILMKEAFGSIPGIELYIYGHSAEERDRNSVELFIYQEGSSYNPKYSLSGIRGRNQNIDHIAIDEVCTRVRKFTDDHVIMFVLSDGCPCASCYGGDRAMSQVKSTVKKWEKSGFDIIQVNIGEYLQEDDMRKMFDKYVYIKESISEFPKALGRIIKKAITADKSTKVQVL